MCRFFSFLLWMFVLQSHTMKLFIFIIYVLQILLPVFSEDVDRSTYCEICLNAAQEIEKAINEAPAESRQTVVEELIRGGICNKLLSYNHNHVSKKKIISACTHLLDSHHEKFHKALLNKELKNLSIVLCYEQSNTCVGVKRQSFGDSRASFTDKDIEALLRDNKDKVRIAQPMYSSSSVHTGEEL